MAARDPGRLADYVAAQVLSSAKYRALDQAFVQRVAGEAATRFADRAQAVKYAKRKLHESFGAFRIGTPARAVTDCLAELAAGADVRQACRSAMRHHASAAERVGWLDQIYQQVELWCGRPASVADLACGLNPLALPWLALAGGASYSCCEVEHTMVEALASLDGVFGVRVRATVCDLVAAPGPIRAELVLLLKAVTTLELQRKGAARAVLAGTEAEHVVLSLPRGSLSGRRSYSDDPDAIVSRAIDATAWQIGDTASFGDEAFYHLRPAR